MFASFLLASYADAYPIVRPDLQHEYLGARCADGQAVDYREYAGLGHVDIVGPGSRFVDDLLRWTGERFEGRAPEQQWGPCTQTYLAGA